MNSNPMYGRPKVETVESSWNSAPEIEITGATLRGETANSVTLRIEGLTVVEPNWEAVEQAMTAAGVEREDAVYLTERFSNEAFQFLFAKAIAQRCRRVG